MMSNVPQPNVLLSNMAIELDQYRGKNCGEIKNRTAEIIVLLKNKNNT